MRFATIEYPDGQIVPGVLIDDKVVDLAKTDRTLPGSVRELLAAGPEAMSAAHSAAEASNRVVAESFRFRAPIPDPQKVICVGLNYKDHAAESGAKIPDEPVIFNKFPTAVIGPDDEIQLPEVSSQVDYEAELVIVIGTRARNVPEREAMNYVGGYMCGHDVSARDWQLQKDGKQWLLGKSFDTFAPTGPVLATTDEIRDPHALAIKLRLNGETMQDSSTSQMIFKTPTLIAYLSQVATLEPGDLIFTGTGPGVGFARKPPVFLQPGDVCEVEIESIGVLRNVCR